MKLYSPTNPKAEPIEVKLTQEETEQMVLGLYKKVNQHPKKLVKKGRR